MSIIPSLLRSSEIDLVGEFDFHAGEHAKLGLK